MGRLAALSGERVRALEAGAPPSTYELSALGRALVVDPRTLLRGDPEADPRRSVGRFRQASPASELSPRDLRLLSLASEVGRTGERLRRLLGKPKGALSTLRSVKALGSGHPGSEGYGLGRAARLALDPEPRPIPSLRQQIEAWGGHVALVDFETPGVEGVSLAEPGSLPVILLNRRQRRVRAILARRAVLAHELCHLLHDGGEADLLTLVSQEASSDPVEQRANGFAPSFLAPEGAIEQPPGDVFDMVVALGAEWGLSYEGSVWHAKNLRWFDDEVARVLITRRAHVPNQGFEAESRVDEATPLVEGLVARLALEAHAEDHISEGRLREILELA